MKKFRKFPSIVQFANVVKHVRDNCKFHGKPLPTITFSGSIKLHGTNAGIGYSLKTKEIWFQSRENIITYEKDNAGFAFWGQQNKIALQTFFENLVKIQPDNVQNCFNEVFIFGEWFGGSIQKGVAISQLKEKNFGIFEIIFLTRIEQACKVLVEGLEIDSTEIIETTHKIDPLIAVPLLTYSNLLNVVVIDDIVPPTLIEINFANPELVQNKLLELTLAVEEECPIGKFFGISGVGEGLVWSSVETEIPRFKTKGEKHSVSKVKTVKELTSAEIESKANAAEFVEYACTENRLRQGIEKLGEMGLDVDIKNMGAFLKWVGSDILTECQDTLIASSIERKDVMPRVADKARSWFLVYLNSELGLAV